MAYGNGFIIFVIILTILPLPSLAKDVGDLKQVEQSLSQEQVKAKRLEQKAHTLSQEMQVLRRKMIKAAREVQQEEGLITLLEDRLVELSADRAAKREGLQTRQTQLAGILSVLEHLPTEPERLFFLHPDGPLAAVRAAILLQTLTPTLRDRATMLREELTALAAVEREISTNLADLRQASQALARKRSHLSALLERKQAAAKQVATAQTQSTRRIAKLAKEAATLRELIEQLDKVRPPPRPAPPAGTSPTRPDRKGEQATDWPEIIRPFPNRGKVPSPATGRLIQRYGQELDFGRTAKGIAIQTRAAAQIIAPHDGRVVFAGPFRNHGLILIVEHRGGYHTVLAGLSRLDVSVNQWVLAGEPVGVMPAQTVNSPSELYVELRRKGQPVNPLGWMRADSIGASG